MNKSQNDQLNEQPIHIRPCPSCGHCPTCGRGGYLRPWPYPQPYWTGPVWIYDTPSTYAVDGNVMNAWKVTC